MKRILFILTILMLFGLACSFSGLVSEEDTSNQETESAVSADRCGDGVCDGSENLQNCPKDCSDDGEVVQQGAASASGEPADWYTPGDTCLMEDIWAASQGSPYAYDSAGNLIELLPDGQVTCVLDIHICGDTIFKQQVINVETEDCPEYLNYASVPDIKVCCDEWEKAKQSSSPCNPLEDADCDGVSNLEDAYPLDYLQH